MFGNRNRVTANVISDAAGCDGGCGFNIVVVGGSANEVTANLVLGGAHDGIGLETFEPDILPLTDTVIRANVVRGAAVDGISVGTETDNPISNTRIEANQVSRAGDDGIDVRRAGTSCARTPPTATQTSASARSAASSTPATTTPPATATPRSASVSPALTCARSVLAQLTRRSQPSRDGATPITRQLHDVPQEHRRSRP